MNDDDYLGRDLTEEQIEYIALAIRDLLQINGDHAPQIYYSVEAHLPDFIPQFGLLPRTHDDLPRHRALTSTRPPTIQIREDIYHSGDTSPNSRYILAHELGHLVLHRELPRSLKDGAQERKLIANSQHRSSEQQADTFAVGLLVPRHVAETLGSIGAIMDGCQVPYWIAVKAAKRYGIKARRKLLPYEVQAMQDWESDLP